MWKDIVMSVAAAPSHPENSFRPQLYLSIPSRCRDVGINVRVCKIHFPTQVKRTSVRQSARGALPQNTRRMEMSKFATLETILCSIRISK
ncbi:hypothetical protein RRG08_017393 [Elysia crispata]|uniref:Uncharacterized protein n=1 Tax=Elysia crispata TaxID=231223 RepID=A0AAE1DAN5_9GAST|nr:hypothetical protein RRG08_017393 [Elysia crispata]